MTMRELFQPKVRLALLLCVAGVACGGADSTGPQNTPDKIVLSGGQVHSLDSAGAAIVAANPSNATLKALVDSALGALTAGVEAKRLTVSTDLTTAPLYFVGIHRAISYSSGSFSTWTLVGFDNPSHLTALLEVSGYAASTTTTPPSIISGTIGDGAGVVNALMLQVGSNGAVTMWNASTGTASFHSDAPSGACPNFTPPNPGLSCALETMHTVFTANSASGSGGATARQASLSAEASVSAMRLLYAP
jgi:hypothetical protein